MCCRYIKIFILLFQQFYLITAMFEVFSQQYIERLYHFYRILYGHVSIYVSIISLRLEKTWWNKNWRSCLKCYKLHKNPSLHFGQHCTKIDHISLIFIGYFFSQTNLVFKFNLVLIGVLDTFRRNLFFYLPFDYHLLFHWSWSSSSASIHFLISTTKLLMRLIRKMFLLCYYFPQKILTC